MGRINQYKYQICHSKPKFPYFLSTFLPPSAPQQSLIPKEGESLSIEQCRQLLGWDEATDDQVQEFLLSLRNMLGRFVDDAFSSEILIDDPK